MSTSPWPTGFNDNDLLANIFDALPSPAMVVDRDVRIIDFNLAAARLLEADQFAVLRPRCAEAESCPPVTEADAGCGHTEACRDCVIRNSVRQVFESRQACRRTGRLHLASTGNVVDFLVTVAPVPNETEPLALLILEDARELSRVLAGPASSSPDSKVRAKAHARKTDSSSSPRNCAAPRRKPRRTPYRSR